jgi:hypothetical protein
MTTKMSRRSILASGAGPLFMRRVICFALYLVMVLVGIGLSVGWLMNGGRNIIFASGGFLAAFGVYLLWTDFVSPKR